MLKLPAELVSRLRPVYEGAHVLITGGAGFIGSHVLDAVLALGGSATVIDDLSNSSAEHVGSLIDLDPSRVRLVIGSILDDDALADAMGIPRLPARPGPSARRPSLRLADEEPPVKLNGTHGPDAGRAAGDGGSGTDAPSLTPTLSRPRVVFHLAAVGSVPRSVADPQRSWSVNVTGTIRVLEAARRAGVSRVVFAASSSAYGDGDQLPREESQPTAPTSPYAASKIAGELAMAAWARSYGLSTVSLRYFNVFGPRQSAESTYAAVVAAFTRAALGGESPVIFGDGTQSRDFTFITNVVLANLLAGASTHPFMGEVLNIGTGTRTDLVTLARQITRIAERPHFEPAFLPARAGDVRHSQADISRARALLGYTPVVGVEEGLEHTLAWYRRVLTEA